MEGCALCGCLAVLSCTRLRAFLDWGESVFTGGKGSYGGFLGVKVFLCRDSICCGATALVNPAVIYGLIGPFPEFFSKFLTATFCQGFLAQVFGVPC